MIWEVALEALHGPLLHWENMGPGFMETKKYFLYNGTHVPKLKLLYFTDCHLQLLWLLF